MSTPVSKPPTIQSGVVPLRKEGDRWQVLLVTSLRSGSWILPKGYIEPDLNETESAEREGWEEAGVRGLITPTPVGQYRFRKGEQPYVVQLYLLRVVEIFSDWPEGSLRSRKWFDIYAAPNQVDEPGLRDFLRRLPTLIEEGRCPTVSAS